MPTVARRVICLGAAHMDIRAQTSGSVVVGSSNPVRATQTRGGVAGNVATWLTKLGFQTSLITRLGSDAAGDRVEAELTGIGVDLTTRARSTTAMTASYTAVLDATGELHIGLADMAIYDEITLDEVSEALRRAGPADAWFLDANLPITVIDRVAETAPETVLLAADTVSVAKAPRLRSALSRLDILVTNEAEASALLGSPAEPGIAATLRAMGPEWVIIGRGDRGAQIADPDGCHDYPTDARQIMDVTGAGDALAAGVLYATLLGHSGEETTRIAMAAAALAVEHPRPVPSMINPAVLLDRAAIAH